MSTTELARLPALSQEGSVRVVCNGDGSEEVCWVHTGPGGTKSLVSSRRPGAPLVSAMYIAPLERPEYIGPQPYLLMGDARGGVTVVVVRGGTLSYRRTIPGALTHVDRHWFDGALVFSDSQQAGGGCIAWMRSSASLWFHASDAVMRAIGGVLVLERRHAQSRALVRIGAHDRVPMAGDVAASVLLESALGSDGTFGLLVRHPDTLQCGVVSGGGTLATVDWLSPDVTEIDGLMIGRGRELCFRARHADGTASLMERSTPLARCVRISRPIVGRDGLVIAAERGGRAGVLQAATSAFMPVSSMLVDTPHAFPCVSTVHVAGDVVRHGVSIVDFKTGVVVPLARVQDMDALEYLAYHDGVSIVARAGRRWIVAHGPDGRSGFDIADADDVDWRRLARSRTGVVVPFRRGTDWHVASGRLECALPGQEPLAVSGDGAHVRALVRDGHLVRQMKLAI